MQIGARMNGRAEEVVDLGLFDVGAPAFVTDLVAELKVIAAAPDHLEVSVGGRVVEMIVVRIVFDGVLRPRVGERLRHAGFAISLKDGGMAPETESRVYVTLGRGVQNGCGIGFIRCVD
jgi:hypothetical protein